MTDKNDTTIKEYYDLLDKLLQLEKPTTTINKYIKIIICVAGGIIAIIFSILLCFLVYKNNFTVESILSVFLAFFSIFMAVLFYFKADEASSKFYDSSYNFMKDVSVTLGKIEERFGEKLNHMNEKLTHMENVKQETKEELKSAEVEKDKLINDLLEKANMSEGEKERYKKSLEAKEEETAWLKNRLSLIEFENRNIDNNLVHSSRIHLFETFFSRLTDSDKNSLLKEGKLKTQSKNITRIGMSAGIIDEDGNLTARGHRGLSSYINKEN